MKKPHGVTGIPVSGSKRHVDKTHGSHNGRTDSWPHVSDRLDRPRKLGGEAVSRAPRWKDRKIRKPMTRINPFNYQDPAIGIPKRASFSVFILVMDWFENREKVQRFDVTGADQDLATSFAWHVAEDIDNIMPLEIVGVSSR